LANSFKGKLGTELLHKIFVNLKPNFIIAIITNKLFKILHIDAVCMEKAFAVIEVTSNPAFIFDGSDLQDPEQDNVNLRSNCKWVPLFFASLALPLALEQH
jgi:hypothetical protein